MSYKFIFIILISTWGWVLSSVNIKMVLLFLLYAFTLYLYVLLHSGHGDQPPEHQVQLLAVNVAARIPNTQTYNSVALSTCIIYDLVKDIKDPV